MTYLEFLIFFLGIPLTGFSLFAIQKKSLGRNNIRGILLMSVIALVYTTPWDNYLIIRGVWDYPIGAVIGIFGFVPIEEYGFMVLQSMLTGIVWSLFSKELKTENLSFCPRGIILALLIGLIGAFCLIKDSGTYLGLLLVWAFIPLALQWGLGGRVIKVSVKQCLPIWIGLTLFLCLADSFAISKGIWRLAVATRTGLELGNLPIEEVLFFALTNLFVIQGMCLWKAWKTRVSR